MKEIINQAVKEWCKQGRTRGEIWAVGNFMSGRGLKMCEEIVTASFSSSKRLESAPLPPIEKITVGEIEEAIQDVRYSIIAQKINELVDRLTILEKRLELDNGKEMS